MQLSNFILGAILLAFPQFIAASPNPGPGGCPSGSEEYCVKEGQTVNSITAYFKMTVPAFQTLNPSITDINVITVGQKVCVASKVACPYTYTVKSGQTATSVSTYFGMTVPEFQAMNPSITDINLIYAGQGVCVKSFCQAPFSELTIKAGDTISGLVNYYSWTIWKSSGTSC